MSIQQGDPEELSKEANDEFAPPRTRTGDRIAPGYAFKHQGLLVQVEGGHVSQKELRHYHALWLMKHKPTWFAENVRRGYYSPSDPYWTKK